MLRLLTYFLVVLALGLLFAWVADRPGIVTLSWGGTNYKVSLIVALAAIITIVAVLTFVLGILKGVVRTPAYVSRFLENRRRDKGYKALSQGLIAASSGDVDLARSLARESNKYLDREPLVKLLATQTALLEGKREEARSNFQSMLQDDDTRLVALRGLFMEAERQQEPEAARHYAVEAARLAPALPWAGLAKLRYQAMDGDWDEAMGTLEANRAAGLVDKETARRQRAVLLTAKAMSEEPTDPTSSAKHAREAHKLAKDLVPAAVAYARAASRQGDIRSAMKVLEACWKQEPHPELAEAYVHVRSGDSVQDRLKRAQKLASMRANHAEGSFAVASAAIDAGEFDKARAALEPVLVSTPTERACLLMADLVEAQHGDLGRMRDWLARAVRAPADPAWTADGQTSQEWLPVSPVSGELDAFEWKVPVEALGVPETVITLEDLKPAPVEAAAEAESEAAEAVLEDAESSEPVGDADLVAEAAPKKEVTEEAEIIELNPASREESASGADASAKDEASADAEDKAASAETDAGEGAAARSEETDKGDSEDGADGSEDKEDIETVKFPLDRRPDDPGVDPSKVPQKSGFKIF